MRAQISKLETYSTATPEAGHALRLIRARGELSGGRRPVLLLHGSTLPATIAYTLPFEGISWLDDLASRGFDAWALDFRGYGESWKPIDDGERPCSPIADTAQAIEDLATAIAFIRKETSAGVVDVVGWSWGATVAAAYAAGGGSCGRLVLHAPQWLRDTPSPMVTPQTMTEPYRTVDAAAFVDRWLGRVDPSSRNTLTEWQATLEQALAEHAPIKVPNGSARDIATQWMAEKPGYDPAGIRLPTLVVVGSADSDTPPSLAREVFDQLGSADKLFVEIPKGTHFAVFEPARRDLFRTIAAFLAADSSKGQETSQ